MKKPKQVVFFSGKPTFYDWDIDSQKVTIAYVYALNHPRLGRQSVRTSQVIEKFNDGSFETLNTIYLPA